MRRLAAALTAVCAFSAHADPMSNKFSPGIWLNPGMYSWHFDQSKDLRNANPGLGVEVTLTPEHVAMAGTFINSRDARSHYGAYAWRPLQGEWAGFEVRAGVILAAMDGYPTYREGGWFVAPLPLVSLEGRYIGVNFSIIPTLSNRIDGAFVTQLKFRVW